MIITTTIQINNSLKRKLDKLKLYKMEYKRATIIGALYWLLVFIEIVFIFYIFNESYFMRYLSLYLIIFPTAIFCAWLYYRKNDKTNGFLVGVYMFGIHIILDAIIKIPSVPIFNYNYFISVEFWIGSLESILIVGFYYLFVVKKYRLKEIKKLLEIKKKTKKKKVTKKRTKKKS